MDTSILRSQAEERDPLAMWLERQFETVCNGQRPERLIIGHLNVHDVLAPLDRFAITGHDGDAARRMTSQLRYIARYDAETRGSLERYAVQVHWPQESGSDPTYFPFSVDGSAVRHSQMTASTEPANAEGLVKMLMRHVEITTRLALQQSVDFQEAALEREKRKDERIAELEEGRMRVIELQESLLSAQVDRQIHQQQAEAAEARKDKALAEFIDLGDVLKPVAARALARLGGASHGESTHDQMRVMFQAMSIDDLKAFLAPMPPAKQAQWLQIYRDVMGVPKEDAGASGAATPEDTKH